MYLQGSLKSTKAKVRQVTSDIMIFSRACYMTIALVVSISRLAFVSTQLSVVGGGGSSRECTEKATCRDCITSVPNCLWCSQPDFDGPRCIDRESTDRLSCSQDEIQDPLGFVNDSTKIQSEQISPISLQMTLRVGEPQNFTVRVTPSSDYPLDLYILMDLSRSMQGDLDNVRSLTEELAARLNEITSDFHLGFGAFNEKPLWPFTHPGQITSIGGFGVIRSTDYSFRHIVSLTDNITKFRNSIDAIDTTANLDAPEAMLEALLQVAVCKEVIGWREAARKLILVMTDNVLHIAGDGKMAGILTKSDGNCYVPRQNSSGLPVDFEAWDRFDYPSLGQVHSKLRDNDIILIIAAADPFQQSYQNIVNELSGTYFQELQRGGGGNFLNIIEESYNTTSQTIELLPSPAQGVQFDVQPICNEGQTMSESACSDVQIGQTVQFEVQVTLTRCLLSTDPSSVVHIPGFGSINVQINGLCNCPCENEMELNSTDCRGYGHISCGVCECLPGRFGSECQCTSIEDVDRACPVSGSQNRECSGRGLCECGVCICNKPNPASISLNVTRPLYFGDTCECDNFNCPTSNEFVCSGRGECSCGVCTCRSSSLASDETASVYRGFGCECLPEEEVCLNPADNTMCSNHGSCLCNECLCDEDFAGKFCNISIIQIDCNGRTCVECTKGLLSSTDCAMLNCSDRVLLIDEVTTDDYSINDLQTLECSFVDSSGCRHYYFVADGEQIHAENTQTCSEGVNLAIPIWAIAAIIVGVLLLIGLLVIVILKICIYWQERREYRKWMKDLNEADFGVGRNPLYTSCKQSYRNVAYEKASQSNNVSSKESYKVIKESMADTIINPTYAE